MSKVQAPKPFGPCPTSRQLTWQRMGMYSFIHFTVNTFTGREWGDGTESPEIFNPSELDCDQWCSLLSETGFKGVIITAKHHDGFCLWPSQYTTHSVASSPWRNGQGDVVGELAKSARKYGLKLGIYLSPWDRHEPCYGSDAYNEHFKNQLREVLTNYGGDEIFEVWFDGACAEGPNGRRQIYAWDDYIAIIRELAPHAVIFSDAGPDIRWVGNEHGEAGATCWSKINRRDFAPGHADTAILNAGLINGMDWLPPEVDVSIRPGWFNHPHEDDQVHSLERLLDIWYHSVGRSACLNLNLPPDTRGLIHEKDAIRLRELKLVLDRTFAVDFAVRCSATASNSRGNDAAFSPSNLTDGNSATYWATDDDVFAAEAIVELGELQKVNVISLKEHTELGQRVATFDIEWRDAEGQWQRLDSATTISFSRILRTPTVVTDALKLKITDALACPCIEQFSAHYQPPVLVAPKIIHDRQGKIDWKVIAADSELDERHAKENAISEKDDLWISADTPYPHELVVDMGTSWTIEGFVYTPPEDREHSFGAVSHYRFFVGNSADQVNQLVAEGSFDNIINNPLPQTIRLDVPVLARYFRFVAVESAQSTRFACVKSLDVMA